MMRVIGNYFIFIYFRCYYYFDFLVWSFTIVFEGFLLYAIYMDGQMKLNQMQFIKINEKKC